MISLFDQYSVCTISNGLSPLHAVICHSNHEYSREPKDVHVQRSLYPVTAGEHYRDLTGCSVCRLHNIITWQTCGVSVFEVDDGEIMNAVGTLTIRFRCMTDFTAREAIIGRISSKSFPAETSRFAGGLQGRRINERKKVARER